MQTDLKAASSIGVPAAPQGASGCAPTSAHRATRHTDWSVIRAEFDLAPDLIYLNSGSEGSMPRRTLHGYAALNEQWAQSPSYKFFSSPRLGEKQTENRDAAGRFVGATADDICLTNNTTMGLAMVLLGLPFKAGDEIVTTTNEHWSLLSPLAVLARRDGVKVVSVPVDVPLQSPEAVVDAFRAAITPNTRAFAFSHITWTTGARLPAGPLCDLAREHGFVSLIDGAHALGTLPLDLPALGCDFYACSGHKWLNGPPGTGLLYIRKAKTSPFGLEPILSEMAVDPGGNSIDLMLQLRGCNNTPGFSALVDSMSFDLDIGLDVIERRLLELSAYTKQCVIDVWGEAASFSPAADRPDLSSGMTAFVPSADPAKAKDQEFINAVVSALWTQHRIYVRSTVVPAHSLDAGAPLNAIRVSTNLFNSHSDIDTLIVRTREIVGSMTESPSEKSGCATYAT